jgi:D-lactate dehydrogenase (cytochrome)
MLENAESGCGVNGILTGETLFAVPDQDHLSDESMLQGEAESIAFPRDEAAVVAVIQRIRESGGIATVQGSRTGICGAAVPQGGYAISMSSMKRILDVRPASDGNGFILRLEPGVTIMDLEAAARLNEIDDAGWDSCSKQAAALFRNSKPHFFPPDPTETTASIGGAASCNASGPRTFHYGPTRNYVEGLRLVLSDGDVIDIKRGSFKFNDLLLDADIDGKQLRIELPTPRFSTMKNAAGFYSAPGMDLVDLVVGSEGTFGVISQIDIRVIPEPAEKWGILCLLPDGTGVADIVAATRSLATLPEQCHIAALEYADARSLRLLERMKPDIVGTVFSTHMPRGDMAAIYIELHGQDTTAMMDAAAMVADLLSAHSGDIDNAVMATNAGDLDKLKTFRHSIPESVNTLMRLRKIDAPELMKVGTDFAVRPKDLGPLMAFMESALTESGLEYVSFGHIGDCNLHTNILPHNRLEFDRALELRQVFSEYVARLGGTLSAEHGLGKIKSRYLALMYSKAEIEAMRRIQQTFDRVGMFDNGNIFGRKG